MNSLGAEGNGFDIGGNGPSDAIAYPNIYQVFGNQASSKVSTMQSSLASWAASQAHNALSADALQQIYQVQANLIANKNAPIVELFYDTGFPALVLSLKLIIDGIDRWGFQGHWHRYVATSSVQPR